jgi:5-methyltetrahydrofolate--homocysteine methyltransferase
VGERLNPAGNPRLRARLVAGDWSAVDEEALAQEQAGADLLDVNGALAGASERETLLAMLARLGRCTHLPLVLDSRDPSLLAEARSRAPRVALLSSVTASAGGLERDLPALAPLGAPIVGLAMDDAGVPPTTEGRFACAERFVRAGRALGILGDRLVVDCLALPGGDAPARANAPALGAMRLVRERLGVPLILGVSNAAFGAPSPAERRRRAAEMLDAALEAGLDYAIANPLDERIRSILRAAKRARARAGKPAEPPASQKERPG